VYIYAPYDLNTVAVLQKFNLVIGFPIYIMVLLLGLLGGILAELVGPFAVFLGWFIVFYFVTYIFSKLKNIDYVFTPHRISNKRLVMICIVCLFLLSFVMPMYLYLMTKQAENYDPVKDEFPLRVDVPLPSPPTNTPAYDSSFLNDITSWKTYVNNSLLYSFKYPPNWSLYSSTDESVLITNHLPVQKGISIDFSSYLNPTNPMYIDVKDEALPSLTADMTRKQDIYVDGVRAVRGYAMRDGKKVGAIRLVWNGRLYFIIYDPYNSELTNTFEDILSTFKFTR